MHSTDFEIQLYQTDAKLGGDFQLMSAGNLYAPAISEFLVGYQFLVMCFFLNQETTKPQKNERGEEPDLDQYWAIGSHRSQVL